MGAALASLTPRQARAAGDTVALATAILPCLTKNFGGHMNVSMYNKTNCGTKVLIEDFVDELEASLKYLTDAAREQADSEGYVVVLFTKRAI